MTAKYVGFLSKIKGPFPVKPNGGRFERLGKYIKNILDDYKSVVIETGQDIKARPLKSSIYISLLTAAGVLLKTNPDERVFNTRLTECVLDLMLTGDLIRNPQSEAVIDKLAQYSNNNRLKVYNLGLCSLLCFRGHDPAVGLYESTCKYVNPSWTEFHKTILDVGVFGRWLNLEKTMDNYDVNPEEWQDDGKPNKSFRFYKENPLITWDLKVN